MDVNFDLLHAVFAVVAFVLAPFIAIALLFGICVLGEDVCKLLRSRMPRRPDS